MKEQTYYYLIGGEIKKGKLMPKIKLFDAALTFVAKQDTWLNSLQPCSIKHRELGELIKYVSENNANIDFYNPIEVTDIIEKDCKSECHLSLSKKCICPDYRFKQPKSEANEVVESQDNIINDLLTRFKNSGKDYTDTVFELCEHFTITRNSK